MPEYKLEGINYDKNGNLQTLKRYAENVGGGSAHLMDDLTYKYTTGSKNKLRVIEDGASNTAGYTLDIDIAHQNSSVNYVYNEIGELTANTEENKGFEYNASGLVPRVFSLSGNNNIATFTYNDKGLRYRKTSYDANGNALQNTYYSYDAGGAQVASYTEDLTGSNPGVLLQDLHLYGAGRVGIYNAASGSALYELTDHLGNVRAVVKDNGSGQAETVSYTDYYPHGSIMPGRNYQSSLHFPYGYQGQEKDAETGLTNFELRQYDGRIGRWYNPDPIGQHHSPYLAMSNNPVSSTDPDGGWDNDWEYGMGPGLYLKSSQQNNPDAFAHSEFDNNYNHGGALGGSMNADGSYTSNDTWVGEAHDRWISHYDDRKSKGQDVAYIPVNPDGSGNLDGEVIAIGRNESADKQYTHIKNRGQAKDKEGGLSKFLGESIFGEQGYSAVKKHAGDNNPYMYTYDEMQDQATEVFWASTYFVPGGEVLQGAKMMAQGTKLGALITEGTNVVYHGIDAAGNVKYVGITSRDPLVRFAEHLASTGSGKELLTYRVVEGATGLSRISARILEQTFINEFKLMKNGGQLLNKMNSIAPVFWPLLGIK